MVWSPASLYLYYLTVVLVDDDDAQERRGPILVLRVKAPGAPHSVTGLASWYMGSVFFGWGCGGFCISLLLVVSNFPAVINYKIFRKPLS